MNKSKLLLSSLVLASALYGAGPLMAAKEKFWNFNNVDIKTLIQQVSTETGKNFVVDPRVQGQVTLISSSPLSSKEAYQVFLSVLQVHGYGAIETGNMIKVVPLDKAKTSGSKSIKGSYNSDELVIKVIPLKFLSSQSMLRSLKPLVSKTSHIASIDEANHLVVADFASNVKRIEGIIAQMDNAGGQLVDVVEVKHASAVELANTISGIISSRRTSKSSTKSLQLAPDERTNSLLVAGGTKELRSYVKSLIRKLDEPTDNQYNSEVIYLKYSDASNLAPIVATFLEDAMRSSDKQNERQQTNSQNRSNNNFSSNISSSSQAPSNHLRQLRGIGEDSGNQGSLFGQNENKPKSGVVNQFVQWDETTNALIVKAPPNLMRAVKSILAKLDIRRPQVVIEVIIAEVALNRAQEIGVEWSPSPTAEAKFGTRFPNTASGNANSLSGDLFGSTVASLGTGLTVGVFRHGNLRVLAKALASDSSANILSTPTLVTLDNQTALIKVGEKIPFAVGETNNQNVGGNPFTSFDREEVGLSLTIKPQITQSGAIKLEIENILSNVIAGTAAQNSQGNPSTSERTIVTNVMIDDGKILVLGGLIQDSWQEVLSEVPLLGRVPWIGEFFRNKSKTLVKRNLMIFLRPVILRDDLEGVQVSTHKYNFMRDAQRRSFTTLDRPIVDERIIVDPLAHDDYYPDNKKRAKPDMYPGIRLPRPFES